MLPPRGGRLIDIGAGAGRLGDLYLGYDEVILMDYARSTIVEARDRWGHDPRFKFVAADLYALPFVDGVFDSVVMIRVIHHIVDVPRALGNIRAALKPGGVFVFEFANKRNLKAIARYLAAEAEVVAVRSEADRVCGAQLRLSSGVDEAAIARGGLRHSTDARRLDVSPGRIEAALWREAPGRDRWRGAAPARSVSHRAEHVRALLTSPPYSPSPEIRRGGRGVRSLPAPPAAHRCPHSPPTTNCAAPTDIAGQRATASTISRHLCSA